MRKFKIILCAILFLIVQDVSAEIDESKYSLTNVVDGKISKMVNDDSFTIELITDEDYQMTSCSGPDFLDYTYENNKCIVNILNYGRGIFNVSLANSDYTSYKEERIVIDVSLDEYLDYIISKIPNEVNDTNGLVKYEYISSLLPENISNSYNCQGNNGKEICDIEISYIYWTNENNENVEVRETRAKKVTFNNYVENYINIYNVNLNVCSEYNLANIFGFSSILYKDHLFISEDDSIATVNQKGIIKGVSTGNTKIKVYNKKTLDYMLIQVNVKGNYFTNINDLLNLTNNKTIDIDVGNYSDSSTDITNYINTEYIDGKEIMNVDYSKLAYNYIIDLFDKKMSNDYKIIYDYYKHQTCENGICTTNLCNENVCNIEFSYSIKGNEEVHTFNVTNFKVNLVGLLLRYNHYSVGNPMNIDYYNFLGENTAIDIIYDEDYFERNNEGDLIPIKLGNTTITVTGTSNNKTYSSTKRINIYEYDVIHNMLNYYIKSLNEIVLPYSSNELIDVNNLKYLENIIKEKIYKEIEIDLHSKNYLDVSVTCLTSSKCLVKTYLRSEDGSNLAGPSYYKYTNIVYIENNATIKNLIELDNKIGENYYLSNDDIIKVEQNSTTENFYNNVLNYIGLNEVINKYSLNVEINKLLDSYIKDDIKEFTSYEIIIKDNQDVLYKTNIKVVYNYIITMPPVLDSSNESKINYLMNYVNNIIASNVVVENIKDNIYKITTTNKSYSVILDQKEKVYYTQISPIHRSMELSLNETKKIEVYYYPLEGTVGNATFESVNPSIATVDENGVVTALKKGFTYIEVIYSGSKSRVLVAIDMTIKDALNTYLDKVPNNVIVEYSFLRWNTLENAIGNAASNLLYEENLFNLGIHVTKEDDKFYAQVSNYENYSDKKEITYELKGIKTKEYVYTLDIGETKDIGLAFSEGDNYNLTFDYSNKGVAVLAHTGKITGLKKGVTNIYINDKFYQYYNHITIIVGTDEVYKEFENNFKDFTMNIDGIEIDDFSSMYSISSEVSMKLSNEYQNLNIYDLWNFYDVDCNNIDTTNKCTLYFHDSTYGNKELKTDINVLREGIYFKDKEVLLDIGESYPISYKLYKDEGNVTIESLNKTICDITDNKIIGISPGVCTIKYSTSNHVNYQHFVVDKEEYYKKINDEVNRLPNNISLKIENKNWYESENHYDRAVFDLAVYDEINKFDKEYVDYYTSVYDEEFKDKDKVVVIGTPKLYFEDVSLDYYYSFRNLSYSDYTSSIEKKELNITYIEIEDEIKEIINKLQNQLPKKYEMSFMQYLRFELETRNSIEYISLFDYSDFKEELNKICDKCTYMELGGGGMSAPGLIESFATIAIMYEGLPIYACDFNVSGGFNVEMDNDFTEEEYLEALKKEFLKAYLVAKEKVNIKPVNSIQNYSVMPLSYINTNKFVRRLNDELEVTIEKSFNEQVKKPEYIFTVEDYSVGVIVNTKVNGEIVYTTKLLDITPDITDITLDVGTKKQVNINFSPKDATNKNVAWMSSNESVVVVKNGLITAVKEGTGVIKVVSEDGNITKEIKVTVKDNNSVIGDVTGDKLVNISDLVTFRKYLAGKATIHQDRLTNADINKDGKTNITDLVNLRKMLAK